MLRDSARGLRVIMHCFSMPEHLDECIEAGWWISFAGNVTYPSDRRARRGRRAGPGGAPAGRDRRALPGAAEPPWQAQRAGRRRRDGGVRGSGARRRAERAGGDARAQRRRAVRLVSTLTQPSLRRLAQFDVRPAPRPRAELPRRLEHPRRDRARRRALARRTSCSRSAAAWGCSRSTSRRASAHVHVVEIDRRLEPALRDALEPFANVTLHLADAMALDLAALRPGPEQADREPALRNRRGRDPALGRGARLADALGGDGAEGRRRAARGGAGQPHLRRAERALPAGLRGAVLRPISRSVFFPVPNVDSVLIGMTQGRAGARAGAAARSCRAAFAHRRKAMARSLMLSIGADRERVRAALVAMGRPPDERAERLAPARRGAVGSGSVSGRAGDRVRLAAGVSVSSRSWRARSR